MAYNLENIISGIFVSFVAAIILRTVAYIFNENKERIKNFISRLWWKKNSGDNNNGVMSINHPNTPFTFNENHEFIARN